MKFYQLVEGLLTEMGLASRGTTERALKKSNAEVGYRRSKKPVSESLRSANRNIEIAVQQLENSKTPEKALEEAEKIYNSLHTYFGAVEKEQKSNPDINVNDIINPLVDKIIKILIGFIIKFKININRKDIKNKDNPFDRSWERIFLRLKGFVGERNQEGGFKPLALPNSDIEITGTKHSYAPREPFYALSGNSTPQKWILVSSLKTKSRDPKATGNYYCPYVRTENGKTIPTALSNFKIMPVKWKNGEPVIDENGEYERVYYSKKFGDVNDKPIQEFFDVVGHDILKHLYENPAAFKKLKFPNPGKFANQHPVIYAKK